MSTNTTSSRPSIPIASLTSRFSISRSAASTSWSAVILNALLIPKLLARMVQNGSGEVQPEL